MPDDGLPDDERRRAARLPGTQERNFKYQSIPTRRTTADGAAVSWAATRQLEPDARVYAGHSGRGGVGTTMTYVRAELQEVATALAALTGEPHPSAQTAR